MDTFMNLLNFSFKIKSRCSVCGGTYYILKSEVVKNDDNKRICSYNCAVNAIANAITNEKANENADS